MAGLRELPTLQTERLVLRPGKEADLEPLARMCQDPKVMEHFPALLSFEESKALKEKIEKHFEEHGFGLWVVVEKGNDVFLGTTGLLHVSFQAWFTPAVEVSWRFLPQAWGKGFATEAAKAVTEWGFQQLGLKEIVAFTTPGNKASLRVMEKLGMVPHEGGGFQHPRIEDLHPLKCHLLYVLKS